MTRLCVALITALYAIAFAFLAIMAVRWPSVLALSALLSDGASGTADVASLINWRQLGLFYGGIYFFAALCFYSCSTLIQRKGRGAFGAFVMGTIAGFPLLTLFDFSAQWWLAPNLFEQIVIGAAGFAVLLMPVIRALAPQKKRRKAEPAEAMQSVMGVQADGTQTIVMIPQAAKPQAQPRRRKPVPPAIARQRASFAAHGRRALAKRMN